jgi:hypothetical protein
MLLYSQQHDLSTKILVSVAGFDPNLLGDGCLTIHTEKLETLIFKFS